MTDHQSASSVHRIIVVIAISFIALWGTNGCSGTMSTLDPAGQGAADIARISWIMIIGTLVFMALMSALWLHAVYRRHRDPLQWPARKILVGGGVVLPTLVIVLLLVYGVRSGESMLPSGPADLEIRATGHQWWWQFEYLGEDGPVAETADELHLPVGARVDIHVHTSDVIHSFWVPSLGGKVDAIPGRTNTLRLQPVRTGRMQGQCAEFCGALHALMSFEVTVHEADAFAAWLDAASEEHGTDP
jgi:cytochrome c oxidase subunit II